MAPSDSKSVKEKDELNQEERVETKDEGADSAPAPSDPTPTADQGEPAEKTTNKASEQPSDPDIGEESKDTSAEPEKKGKDQEVAADPGPGKKSDDTSAEPEKPGEAPEVKAEHVQGKKSDDTPAEPEKKGEDQEVAAHPVPKKKSDDTPEEPEKIVKDQEEDTAAAFDYSTLSREDLINRLDVLLEAQVISEIRSDVDNIKLNYYKKFKAETEQLRKKFVEEGGNIEDFKAPEDRLESRLKDLLTKYKALKAEENKRTELEREQNLEKKYEVIEKIKDLVNRKESINKTFQEFRDLQKEWRSIGLVPQPNVKDLWGTYNYHIEKFYDYININKELRDLDFKKNLEAKISLCEKAEKLLLEPSVLNAFNILQKYHDQWREIGPVPPEMRTEIWDRFKEATSKINKKHQQYYSDLKKEQKNNLEQKRVLCEQAEEISNLVLSSHKEWERKSQELIELQRVWRTIGFAPKKDNNKIYQRFRTACDQFFNRKREFYTQNKEMQQNNLQMKTDLCIQAESLQESNEWKKTTEDLINFQKQWKKIGPVPRRQSDQVWKRFRAACDHFFERKAKYYSNIDQMYEENLREKENLLKELEEFKLSGSLDKDFKSLNEFQRRWTDIGFVPFKAKDDIQEKYRVMLNKHYDNLKIDDNKRNLLKFRNRINNILQKPKSDLKLNQEREKFVMRLQQLNSDIVLWENNIGFFAKTKNAQHMIDEVNNKIENARKTIQLLESKIEMIDNLEQDNK